MRHIYSLLLYLVLPFILLRLFWKGRRMPAYRQRIAERFAMNSATLMPVDVWLHAVSLGEVVAATPLIEALLAQHLRVLVTTMTPTGSEQIVRHFANKVTHQYVPYDFPWALRRFYKRISAKIGILMETELWPNLIIEAKRYGLPLILANARISDKAYPQYYPVRFLFKPVLRRFSAILAQSEQDSARFIALGAPKTVVKVVGNLKFDIQTKTIDSQFAVALKNTWGSERVVVIAASTHDDEEHQLLLCLKRLQQAIPGVLLLLTPRHPDRFESVYVDSKQLGFNTQKRSVPALIDTTTEVIVIDAMGELMGFYRVSDYAFVGGSLVPIGGHNVLEPIALNVPVFCGPYMQNSKSICDNLCVAKAMQQVNDADTLMSAIITLHQDQALREIQVLNATRVLMDNRGTVQRHLDEIHTILLR